MLSHRLTVQVQVNQVSCRFLIVRNEIAHQNVENVIIDGNSLFEARHRETVLNLFRNFYSFLHTTVDSPAHTPVNKKAAPDMSEAALTLFS